jgi:hypothetical protein
MGDRIEHKIIDVERRRTLVLDAADLGVDAGDEFFGMDRLDDEIIGAGVQPFDLFLPAAARRQDDDRGAQAARPPGRPRSRIITE